MRRFLIRGAVIGALIFGVPGAVLGAGIGALIQTNASEPAVPEQPRFALMPGVQGIRIGLSARF
jgi:hypothetical protein